VWQVLFLWWMMIYGNATDEEYAQSMRGTGNRYVPAEAPGSPARRAGSRRKRRLADAAKGSRLYMIPKSGYRFSEKIMLKQRGRAG